MMPLLKVMQAQHLEEVKEALSVLVSRYPSLDPLQREVAELGSNGEFTADEVELLRERLYAATAELSRDSATVATCSSFPTPPNEVVLYRAPNLAGSVRDEDAIAALQEVADWVRSSSFEGTTWGDMGASLAITDTNGSEPLHSRLRNMRDYSPALLMLLLIPQGMLFAPYTAVFGAFAAFRWSRATSGDSLLPRERSLTEFVVTAQRFCDRHRVPLQVIVTGVCFVAGAVVNVAPGIGQTLSPVLLGAGAGGASLAMREYLHMLDLPRAVSLVHRRDFGALLDLLADSYTALNADPSTSSWSQYFATVGLGAVAAGGQGSVALQTVTRVAGVASTSGLIPGLGVPSGTPLLTFVSSFVGGSANNPLTRKVLEAVIYYLLQTLGQVTHAR